MYLGLNAFSPGLLLLPMNPSGRWRQALISMQYDGAGIVHTTQCRVLRLHWNWAAMGLLG